MSRIVSLGIAAQEVYLIDRDDFEGAEVAGQSIFGKLVIGSQVDIDNARYSVGGSGMNAAVSFARYGHEAIFMGNIGKDVAGEAVIRCLDEENIDSSYLEIVRGSTASSVVLLDAKTGNSTTLAFRGVAKKNQNLNPSDLDLIQPDWLYASSLSGDMEKLLEFFEHAHDIGAKVMFSPGEAELAQPEKMVGLLEDTDILIVNKSEAAEIVPGVLLTELLSHLANYCETVIITDGIMGAIATDHRKTYRLGVYEQGRTRDLNGAGDAFGSGFLAAYAKTHKFKQSLCFAAANAAKVTQNYGSEAGILTGSEELHPMPINEIKDLED